VRGGFGELKETGIALLYIKGYINVLLIEFSVI
jgi:hypothetical protein